MPKVSIGMPGFIVTVLLAYFGLALFEPWGLSINSSDNPLVQTLINVTIAAVSYFIGTSQGSQKKDDIIANSPPVAVPPSTVTTTVTPASDATTPKETP